MQFPDFLESLHMGFATGWADAGPMPHAGKEIPAPGIVPENGGYGPGVEPYIELHLITDQGTQYGTYDIPTFRHLGILQVSMFVPNGWGIFLFARMRNRAQSVIRALEIPGFKTYTTSVPRPGPSPPDGFSGKQASTNFSWTSQDDAQ